MPHLNSANRADCSAADGRLASRLDPAERRRFAVLALALVAALLLPYLWALAITPPGTGYSGLLYNPDDQNVHLAWARQAAQGHFFVRDLFTTEWLGQPGRPLFSNLLTGAIGAIAALTHLPLIWPYHALRLLFAVLALWWFAQLCALFTTDRRTRFIALLLVAFSGGGGWLSTVLPGRVFIDRPQGSLMMPEAFTFTSAFVFPLNIAAMALLVLTLWCTARARLGSSATQTSTARAGFTRGSPGRAAMVAAVAALVLGNIHTYDIIPLDLVLLLWLGEGLWQNYRRSESEPNPWLWRAPLAALCGTLPPLLYQYFVFANDRVFRAKALTITAAPPLPDVLLSYAPLLLPSALGAVLVWRAGAGRGRVMLVWAVAALGCSYLPVSFARKMMEGLHLPLCFLAAVGLAWLLSLVAQRPARRVLLAACLVVLSWSSLSFVAWCLANAAENNRTRAAVYMPPLYLTAGDSAALQALGSVTDAQHAVLCLPYLGNYVPRLSGRAVFVGHWAETLNFYDPATRTGKITEVQRFYGLGPRPMSAAEAARWLHQCRIGCVMMGYYEKALGARLPLPLPVLWSAQGTTLYRVP